MNDVGLRSVPQEPQVPQVGTGMCSVELDSTLIINVEVAEKAV